jgi:hypothetical protein
MNTSVCQESRRRKIMPPYPKPLEVLQLCSHPVIGWQDAPPGIFGLWFIQVAAI